MRTGSNESAYIEGIRRAEQCMNREGQPCIVYADDERRVHVGSEDDKHCHIDVPGRVTAGFDRTNMRDLESQAVQILCTLQECVHGELRIAFSGAGVGLECAQARRICPTAFFSTIGLSPIDPFLFPLFTRESLLSADILRRYIGGVPASVLVSANTSQAFFRPTETPFIDEQRIGWFAPEFSLRGQYHLLYDSFGPFEKQTSKDFPTVMGKTQEHIHTDGYFFLSYLPDHFGTHEPRPSALKRLLLLDNAALVGPDCVSCIIGNHQRIQDLFERQEKCFEGWKMVE